MIQHDEFELGSSQQSNATLIGRVGLIGHNTGEFLRGIATGDKGSELSAYITDQKQPQNRLGRLCSHFWPS